MRRLHFERAVVGPEIDRIGYAGTTSLIDLGLVSLAVCRNNHTIRGRAAHHFSRFGSSNIEFEISIFLPVPKKERELEQKSVVGIADGGERLRARVSVETAVESFASLDQALPALKVVWVRLLSRDNRLAARWYGPT